MSLKKIVRVVVMDDDYYARQAIVSLLAWDRRTQVIGSVGSPHELLKYLDEIGQFEIPDVVLLDTEYIRDSEKLGDIVQALRKISPKIKIVCISQSGDLTLSTLAAEHGASAFLVKDEVRYGLPSAVFNLAEGSYLVTESIFYGMITMKDAPSLDIRILPGPKHFPELTNRMEQVLRYYVIGGMSAELTADEMGVSENTIRTFIQHATKVLRAYDERIYSASLNNREKLFQQYTALEDLPKILDS